MKPLLTAARLRELLHYDPATGVFTNRITRNNNGALVGEQAGAPDGHGYIHIRIDRRFYRAHRLAWLYVTGDWPADQIDHEDRDKSNNRWTNLRPASNSFNMQNAVGPRANNKSGFLGVIPHGSGFRAQIMLDGRTTSLGTYRTPEEASAAYWQAKPTFHPGAVQANTSRASSASLMQ